jgi:DNA repair exonuclease SbcCD ATPase subunit
MITKSFKILLNVFDNFNADDGIKKKLLTDDCHKKILDNLMNTILLMFNNFFNFVVSKKDNHWVLNDSIKICLDKLNQTLENTLEKKCFCLEFIEILINIIFSSCLHELESQIERIPEVKVIYLLVCYAFSILYKITEKNQSNLLFQEKFSHVKMFTISFDVLKNILSMNQKLFYQWEQQTKDFYENKKLQNKNELRQEKISHQQKKIVDLKKKIEKYTDEMKKLTAHIQNKEKTISDNNNLKISIKELDQIDIKKSKLHTRIQQLYLEIQDCKVQIQKKQQEMTQHQDLLKKNLCVKEEILRLEPQMLFLQHKYSECEKQYLQKKNILTQLQKQQTSLQKQLEEKEKDCFKFEKAVPTQMTINELEGNILHLLSLTKNQ